MISLFDAVLFYFLTNLNDLYGFTDTLIQESAEDAKYDSGSGSWNTGIGSAEDDGSTVGVVIPGVVG